jgi:hypothetical protein
MKKSGIKINGNLIVLVIALIAVVGVFSLLNRNYFTTVNMVNILIAASLVGLVAIGHTYLIIEGQNDLSPGSLVAFLGVLSALLVSRGVSFGVTLLITMVVGVDVNGEVTGVTVTAHSEHAGVGDQAMEAGYLNQYVGLSGTVRHEGRNSVDAVSGATDTSRAITAGVNKALYIISHLETGDVEFIDGEV